MFEPIERYPFAARELPLGSTTGGRLALGKDRWRADDRPEHLKTAGAASPRRPRLETIDRYQLNAVDPPGPARGVARRAGRAPRGR